MVYRGNICTYLCSILAGVWANVCNCGVHFMRIHVFNTTEAIVRTCNMWACSTRSIEYLCAWLRRIKKCTNSCVCVRFAIFDSIHIGAYLANYSFNFLITSHLYVALCGCVVINEGEYANYTSNKRLWTRPHFLNQSLYLRDTKNVG